MKIFGSLFKMKKFRRVKAISRGGGRGVTQPTEISEKGVQRQHQQNVLQQDQQQLGQSVQQHPTTHQQHVEQSVQQQHVQEQQLLPDQEGKIELNPNGLWFWNTKVATIVSKSFKAHYNEAYNSFEEVPTAVKEHWFTEFKRTYTWRPEFEIMARKEYLQKCVKRFSDSLNKVAKLDPSVPMEWMEKNVRADFIKKRNDPAFVARSAKARANRCASQIENTNFDPGHRQGRVSTRQVAENMASENDGVLPTAADVYERGHSVVVGANEDLDLVGDKPRKIMGEYEQKLENYKQKGIEKDPNDVYLEVVGGQKRGGVYGLGNAAPMFFKKSRRPSETRVPTYTPSVISQMSSQFEVCKKMAEDSKRVAEENLKLVQDIKEQLDNERTERKMLQERDKEREGVMLQMQSQLLDISSSLISTSAFFPSNTNDT